MALPKLELPIHKIVLPISKQKIDFRPFVMREEKSFLTSINTENKEDIVELFKTLVNACVLTETFKIEQLNVVDLFYLILQIRMKSTGETIEGKLKCSECGKDSDFSINLEEALKIQNQEHIDYLVTINKDLSLQLVPPKIEMMLSLKDMTKFQIIGSSIKSVLFKNIVYTDFDQAELEENILSNLTQKDFDVIGSGMEQLARIVIDFDFTCTRCAKPQHYFSDDIIGFF